MVDEEAFEKVLASFKIPCTEGERKAMRLFAESYESARSAAASISRDNNATENGESIGCPDSLPVRTPTS